MSLRVGQLPECTTRAAVPLQLAGVAGGVSSSACGSGRGTKLTPCIRAVEPPSPRPSGDGPGAFSLHAVRTFSFTPMLLCSGGLISCLSSPSSLTRPLAYRKELCRLGLFFCQAASMTSGGGVGGDGSVDPPSFVCFVLFLRYPHQERLCILLRHYCQAKGSKHFHENGRLLRQLLR